MSVSQASIDAILAEAGESLAAPQASSADAAGPATSPGPRVAEVSPANASPGDLRRILGLSLPVTVTLAERMMAVEMVLAIRVGTIVEFDVPFDAELTLCVANHPIGKGHAVKVGENFGLRVTGISTVQDRIEALGDGSSQA